MGVRVSACSISAGKRPTVKVPAMLAITTPEPPGAMTLPNSSRLTVTP